MRIGLERDYLASKMGDDDDYDFFDSPRRPGKPSPGLHGDYDELETDRKSVLSSARSNASYRIEARVPSIASDLYTDSGSSDSDFFDREQERKSRPKHNRPKSSKENKRQTNTPDKPPRPVSGKKIGKSSSNNNDRPDSRQDYSQRKAGSDTRKQTAWSDQSSENNRASSKSNRRRSPRTPRENSDESHSDSNHSAEVSK